MRAPEGLEHHLLIDIDGLPRGPLPEEAELATALDSWWLLGRCQEYGVSKQGLIEAVTRLSTLTASEWADLARGLFGTGETASLLEHVVGDKKIEDVTLETGIGEVRHELSMEEKVAEIIALGVAFIIYIYSLTRPESQPAVFGMGHKREELVVFWCKDPSKRESFRANFLSRNAFELTRDGILELDFVRRYPEICDIQATEFLECLTKAAGTKEVNLLSGADHIGSVMTALLMGRQDLVQKINDILAQTLEKQRVEPSDYDRDGAQSLLRMKLKEIREAGIFDGSAIAFDNQMLRALKALFDPSTLPEFSSLPEAVQRDVPKEIYTLICLKLRRNRATTFDEMAGEAIDELKQSYSWEGFAKHGAAFSDAQLRLSAERIGEILQDAERIFAKSGLTERQTKVLKLEIILCLRGDQGKWTEADKAKYLGMREGNYREHLYQARLRTQSARHAQKELNGHERLLRAIFGDGTLTKS